MLSIMQTEVRDEISIRSTANPAADVTEMTNHFEFWPAWTIHFPMYLLGIYWGIRLGNLNFFTAVNPSMENGGLFNYSKFGSMKGFSEKNIPKSVLSLPLHQFSTLLEKAFQNEINYPFILKPDIGERGRGVTLISNQIEAENHLKTYADEAVILQEFVSKKEEYGVFIIRNPETGQINIPSITQKIPLQVKGNGKNTVAELIQKHPRAKRYTGEISLNLLGIIPEENEIFQLSHKGNHCKGALFLDRSELITEEVKSAFEKICQPFEEFFYGRLDVKVNTATDLGKPYSVTILEVNGANSEPIHIYSPGNSYLKSLQIISNFFAEMAKIARFNMQSMNSKPSLSALLSSFQSYMSLKKNTHE